MPEVKIKISEFVKILWAHEREGKEYLTIDEIRDILNQIEEKAQGTVQ